MLLWLGGQFILCRPPIKLPGFVTVVSNITVLLGKRSRLLEVRRLVGVGIHTVMLYRKMYELYGELRNNHLTFNNDSGITWESNALYELSL